MFNFDFLENGLGIVSPSPNLIVWLPLLLEILGNMCIKTVYFPGCDVIIFEINPFNQAVFLHDQEVKTKI